MNIKKSREKLGLSRKELAAKMGVSPRTVEGWEQGRRDPSNTVIKLLEVMSNEYKTN